MDLTVLRDTTESSGAGAEIYHLPLLSLFSQRRSLIQVWAFWNAILQFSWWNIYDKTCRKFDNTVYLTVVCTKWKVIYRDYTNIFSEILLSESVICFFSKTYVWLCLSRRCIREVCTISLLLVCVPLFENNAIKQFDSDGV